MTMDGINLVLHKITSTQIETINLIDNIHRPKDLYYPLADSSISCLGTVKDEDVRSRKQNIKKLYENQISQSKV